MPQLTHWPKAIGTLAVIAGLALFTASLGMNTFSLKEKYLEEGLNNDYHYHLVAPFALDMLGKTYTNTFSFNRDLHEVLQKGQEAVRQDLEQNKGLTPADSEYWSLLMQDYVVQSVKLPITRAAAGNFQNTYAGSFGAIALILVLLGSFFLYFPLWQRLPGIDNTGVFVKGLQNRGWPGILLGAYLIVFYLILYFYPQHLVNWMILIDPISYQLNKGPASQWFVYGLLYTFVILVMGIRMILKYRHNAYQIWRTGSVMFFQTCFAFLLPQLLAWLNQPAPDLKNIWPLDYSFFFDYRIKEMIQSGTFGLFLLFWGIALTLIGVPVFTYFFGKRWYCSWVCGCGGLAETMGDPFRHLSDKRLRAWQVERWLIHLVLVFAVVMTIAVVYAYLPKEGPGLTKYLFFALSSAILLLALSFIWFFNQKIKAAIPQRALFIWTGTALAIIGIGTWQVFAGDTSLFFVQDYQLRSWYGFYIGSVFAGVVGTGFYPLMGNRVWCRFGCPLAAYLGLVQRIRSKFRITVNGSQCISCGNCSTYCEMGIDVRAYAQKGQDILRSSCVGCGICAAVCPRGVLKLENGSADIHERAHALRAIHISETEVKLMH